MIGLNRTVVAPLSSAIITVLLAGVVVVGVDRSGVDIQPGEARLEVKGVAEVSLDGEDFVRLEGTPSRILSRTDRVRVVQGIARLELPDDASAELRQGSAVAIADGEEATLVLEAGDLLVQAPQDTIEVDGGTAVVSVVGAAKLRRNASLVAGVYDGNALMVRDRNRFPIPRYRQAAAVGTGLLPDVAEPLSLSSSDIWDLRMLPEVLNLDHQLNVLGRNFESTLPEGMEATPEVFATVMPGIAESITPGLLAGRAARENLIGLVLVALESGSDVATRAEQIFGFRSAGASWGLVAADRELRPVPVIGELESALAAVRSRTTETDGELASGITDRLGDLIDRNRNGGSNRNGGGSGGGEVAAPPPQTPPPPGGTGGTPPGGGAEPGGGGAPGGETPPPGQTPPPTTPPPPDKRLDLPPTGTFLDPLLEPVVDPLENLLSGVLDTLLGPVAASEPAISSSPSTSTTTTTAPDGSSGSGGLLGGLTGGLLGG